MASKLTFICEDIEVTPLTQQLQHKDQFHCGHMLSMNNVGWTDWGATHLVTNEICSFLNKM